VKYVLPVIVLILLIVLYNTRIERVHTDDCDGFDFLLFGRGPLRVCWMRKGK